MRLNTVRFRTTDVALQGGARAARRDAQARIIAGRSRKADDLYASNDEIERAAPARRRYFESNVDKNTGWQNVGCRPGLYRVSALGKNTRHRSVKCFPRKRSWLRRFRMVGIILDTVASNVLLPFHTQTMIEVLAAQALRPSFKAATIVRSAPGSARAHPTLRSVVVVRGVVSSPRVSSQDPLGPSSTLSDRDCG